MDVTLYTVNERGAIMWSDDWADVFAATRDGRLAVTREDGGPGTFGHTDYVVAKPAGTYVLRRV